MEIAENNDPVVKPPLLLAPWMVLLAGLALYGLTLNHWVTFASLPDAAALAGWDWHPGPLAWKPALQNPLLFILTLPLRLLSPAARPIGLNIFTAICAALTLAILARSANLLAAKPTATKAEQKKGVLKWEWARAAFLPTGFAVLLLATQMTFWENAIAATGQMLNLLVFAFLILCLLEYRVSLRSHWLTLFALVYGMGMADNWALLGFFPCFLVAMLALAWKERVAIFSELGNHGGTEGEILWKWLRSVVAYNWKFVLTILAAGTLGLLLYALIPLLGAMHGDGSFGTFLHQKFSEQQHFLTRTPRYFAVIAGMMTLIPAAFAMIASGFRDDDVSPGAGFTRELVRLLNLVCLAVGVLMFFDVRLSPNPRMMGMGATPGTPGFLTFYYLAALNVAYVGSYVLRVCQTEATKAAYSILARSGYNLLVFGRTGIPRSEREKWLWSIRDGAVVGLLWTAAIVLPAVLFCANYPQIQNSNSPAVAQFGKALAESLPPTPALVFSDDPTRLYLAMGASQKLGLTNQYAFIETRSLVHGDYLRYLADRYPVIGTAIGDRHRLPEQITERDAADLMTGLVQRIPAFYLHPSFGTPFERICLTPHRLGANLHPAPTNLLENLSLSAAAITANQDYWLQMEKEALAALPELARTNLDARRIAGYYSQALDYWGTELQKTGTRRKLPALLQEANDQFQEAILLDTNNFVARVNQQYNARLRNVPVVADVVKASDLVAQLSGHWELAMSEYGPPDAPELDFAIGRDFAQHGLYMQAARFLQRGLELAPANASGELDLANTYVNLGLPDSAEAILKDMRQHATGNALDMVEVEALACVTKNDFSQADKLLTEARSKNPKDYKFTGVTAEIYRLMGYQALRASKENPQKSTGRDAAQWFGKSLTAFDEHLRSLTASTADLRSINLATLRKAEMQMMMTNY